MFNILLYYINNVMEDNLKINYYWKDVRKNCKISSQKIK